MLNNLLRSVSRIPAGRWTKWLVLLSWVIAIAVAAPYAGKLFEATNDDAETYLPASADSTEVVRLREQFQDGQTIPLSIVYQRDSGITAADLERANRDLQLLVDRFGSVRDAEPVVSDDGQAVMIAVSLPEVADGVTDTGDHLIDNVRDIRNEVGTGDGDLTIAVTGPAGVIADEISAFDNLDIKLLLAPVIVVALLLLVIYRSPVLWLIPLLSVALAAQLANATVYGLASNGMVLSSMAAGVLGVLVYGAGTDYALLLISRYREELRRHEDRHQAMQAALSSAAPAILAAAATTTAALLCLLAADLNSNRTLGPIGSIGIIASMLAMLTLLPALLVILGRWVFWPAIPHYGTAANQDSRIWSAVGRRISKAPRLVWSSVVILLLVMALGLTTLNSSLSLDETFRDQPESITGANIVADHFSAGAASPLDIIARSDQADAIIAAAEETPGVATVYAINTSGDLTWIQATLTSPPGSDDERATIDLLRSNLSAVTSEPAYVGGESAANLDIHRANIRDMLVVVPLVLLALALIIGLLLRSLVAPLVLVATVVLSFAASLGLATLIFQNVVGFAGVDVTILVLAFVFLVALGIDYNIFLMSRVKEESTETTTHQGTLRGLIATGGVITSAGLVLAATFSVLFVVMPLVAFAELGFIVALGILVDTFIVRSVLVPSISLDLDRRIWWPGRLSRQSQRPRFDETATAVTQP